MRFAAGRRGRECGHLRPHLPFGSAVETLKQLWEVANGPECRFGILFLPSLSSAQDMTTKTEAGVFLRTYILKKLFKDVAILNYDEYKYI